MLSIWKYILNCITYNIGCRKYLPARQCVLANAALARERLKAPELGLCTAMFLTLWFATSQAAVKEENLRQTSILGP
jgi:hypothetical protein